MAVLFFPNEFVFEQNKKYHTISKYESYKIHHKIRWQSIDKLLSDEIMLLTKENMFNCPVSSAGWKVVCCHKQVLNFQVESERALSAHLQLFVRATYQVGVRLPWTDGKKGNKFSSLNILKFLNMTFIP